VVRNKIPIEKLPIFKQDKEAAASHVCGVRRINKRTMLSKKFMESMPKTTIEADSSCAHVRMT